MLIVQLLLTAQVQKLHRAFLCCIEVSQWPCVTGYVGRATWRGQVH